jgi:hypothetical protein
MAIATRQEVGPMGLPTQSNNRLVLWLGVVGVVLLAVGGVVGLKMRHPITGRIYRSPGVYHSDWTEKEVEALFGSSGKVVPGRGSPHEVVKEWRGQWCHYVITFDRSGKQLRSESSCGGAANEPPFLERLEAFLGLDHR